MAAPKLRFKEFDGDWKQETLKNLATFSKGKGISKADISEDGINLCIRYGELYTTYGQVIDHIHSKTNVSKSECILSKAGDVIIPASGETQIDIATASCVLHDDIILSGDLNILSHEENGSWLAYYLSSAKKLEIAQLAQGNSVVHLYSSQLKDLKINKPSKEEQTKIASFLSNVDEKISQLTQKLELLSQYKQGMMQKLFSQQIRFKADDGSEFGEWEEKALKTIARIYDGTHQTPNYVEDGVPFYSVEHVTANNFSKTKFIAENVFLDELKRVQLEKNDILLTRIGDIGTSKLIDWDVRASFYVSLALIKVDKNHNSSFVNQYIKSIFFQKELPERTIHVAFPKKINLGEIGLCLIRLPCLAEQTKIANFLSAIDQKIEVVAQQIEQAKTWKKGLLQQMFI